ncbi:MAG: carbohydrate-binding domain-containing protein, partial [Oscillospiraceae bacterium]|nr:carbohydrate-binding domain-containing protein [Oscillospiraceae bacterium]
MKLSFKTLAAFVAVSAMMTGCSKNDNASNGSSNPLIGSTDNTVTSGNVVEITGGSAERLDTVDAETDCKITFEDEGPIFFSGSGVSVTNNTVNITKSGVYELSGSCSDCKITINAGKKDEVTLLLNNVTLSSQNGSVIDCKSAKILTLFSNVGTVNSLSDSDNYMVFDDGSDAAVFTRSDLVINGAGKLTVNGKYGDALKCKDAVEIYNGSITVIAADDGITGKDSVAVYGGSVNVTSGGDGIKSTNDVDADRGNIVVLGGELAIESEKDGIQAEKALVINGGKITITAGGEAADAAVSSQSSPWDFDKRGQGGMTAQGSQSSDTVSQKGIKAGSAITINNGEINVRSADDSIHSNASVDIYDGTLLLSSCDDGIHAEETLKIVSGDITITKSYEGIEGKCIEIEGGTISLKAVDDGLNAAGGDNGSFFGFGQASDDYYIRISGGDITVDADGDGIDSNGIIAQSGGVLTVYGPTNSGNGAIDYERSYAMSGGTLIALGAQGMAQAPSTLSQPCLSINAQAAAGSVIEVRDGSEVILTATTPKNAQSLIFSSDKMKAGTEYGLYVNDELVSTVTAENGVSGNGGSGNGGFGGGHGGFGGGQDKFPDGQGGFGDGQSKP